MKSYFYFLLFGTVLLSSSCASILNSKYQRVTVLKQDSTAFYFDGKKPQEENGRYLIERNYNGHQIELRREGYKTEYTVQGYHKASPLKYMSLLLVLPYFYDFGNKAYKYPSVWDYSDITLKEWPVREEDEKEIQLNKVDLNVNAENYTFREFRNFQSYLSRKDVAPVINSNEGDSLVVENTQFQDILNEILAEKGYIDTTRRILKNSYINNMKINATVEKVNIDLINKTAVKSWVLNPSVKHDLTVKWEVLDYYDNVEFEMTTDCESGVFTATYYGYENVVLESFKDAIEDGLIDFLNNEEVHELLKDRSQLDVESAFEPITLITNNEFVTTLPESIKSSVTIFRGDDKGHGSGFIVSNDGYIVTNYHVVARSGDSLSVMLSNGEKHKGVVVRESKVYDLALVKIEKDSLRPIKISAKDIEIAEDVYAVGTPTAEDLGQTITKGIVSARRKRDGGTELIQTDASVNAGNSGGALLNKEGVVIGVVSSKVNGIGIEGIAFGIPSKTLFEKLKLTY